MTKKLKGKRSRPVWLDAQAPLRQWYSTSLGQSIADRLEIELNNRLCNLFGYQGLQVGNLVPGMQLFSGAGLQRQFIVDAPQTVSEPQTQKEIHDGSCAHIQADVLSLPIASGTMKAVAFFHTLDFCDHPHQALREANRVLTDDGELIIIGFNPYSAFGARHSLMAWRRREPWNGCFYARHRVSDWLSVLDYRVLGSNALFLRPPINSERMMHRLEKLEKLHRWFGGFGGIYIMHARKQTLPMSMIRQRASRARKPLAAGSLARTGGHAAAKSSARVARIGAKIGETEGFS